jgi:hypothetical protein
MTADAAVLLAAAAVGDLMLRGDGADMDKRRAKLVKSDTRGTREAETNEQPDKQANKHTKPIKTVVP